MSMMSMRKQRQTMPSDVIVIGGGAAGMMAAHAAALYGKQVLLLEKNNRLGKKILITGKGRCNITNRCDTDTFIRNVPQNGRFLYSAVNQLTPEETIAYFENSGLSVKTERGNRVFPVSDRAGDVADVLERNIRECGVEIRPERVTRILTEGGAARGVECESGERYLAPSVILATGGLSYPRTGSTGDGYRLAENLGHRVTELKPSLIPIVTEEVWCKKTQGLSLKNVTLSLVDRRDEKVLYSELGEMLFTHFGVSGPLVLSASSHLRRMEPGRYLLRIDLKPGLSEKQLDARILRDFSEQANKDFGNSLGKLLPKKLIPVIVRLSGIPYDQKVNQITREMRGKLCGLIKNLTLTVSGFRPIEEAIITSGGVDVKEISPKTMESRLVKGLFFAGEVIDVDAYTGGFNLQIAFSTGYTAGINC